MEKFQWPKGTYAELEVYTEDNPQLAPTMQYFAEEVRRNIRFVREGKLEGPTNLWLLIDSLRNLTDPNTRAGFHTWLWAMERVLGVERCRAIGKQVCADESFTIAEGLHLQTQLGGEDWRTERQELTAFAQKGRWYQVKSSGEVIGVAEINSGKKVAIVFNADMFATRSGVAFEVPLSELTYLA